MAWHALRVEEVVAGLATDTRDGLASQEATSRLQVHGPNTLQTLRKTPWYTVFLRQFVDVLIIILFVAAGLSVVVGELTDAITILVIVALNGVLGFVQEWKAEKAIEALQRMLSPNCKVVRDGHEQTIEARDLVPGDIVALDTGDHVPADLRLATAVNLMVDESSLTGESVPVDKSTMPVGPETLIAERASVAWMGTAVTSGRGRGVVVATGMDTEFGRIALLTQSVDAEATPLQRKLAVLGKQLGVLSVAVSLGVVLTGWALGKPFMTMLLTGVSLAVAVVPEGLPAVVTITLALGIRGMVRRNALLRRLQAAETLGAATVICTDKTGTLTQNEMTVQRVWLPSGEINVDGVGYDPAGHFAVDGHRIDHKERADLMALLETGLFCNHGSLYNDALGWHPVGDPTEVALVVAAYKSGLRSEDRPDGEEEIPFTSSRKRMTVIEHRPEHRIAHVKGAPEVILERCKSILDGEVEREMTPSDRRAVDVAYKNMAGQGLRVLALARRVLRNGVVLDEDQVEGELTLLGTVGIADPPRREVPNAIRLANTAGISIVMITGDAADTAVAIARSVGLRCQRAVLGNELDAMSDTELEAALKEQALFARTTPEQKMRIVNLLQEMGHVVGMTGDGVNDAPALKKADIGIAMGIRGTDVAKSASDMILVDDNFASIIGAVEEGRRQYDNIQKFVRYLLSSNTAELVAIFLNILLRGPLILLPVQILWMNLVTDGATAVALGLERPEKGVMLRPPRSPKERILGRGSILLLALIGGYMGLATLWIFHRYLDGSEETVALAQTVAFTGLIMLEKMNVFNFRSLGEPLRVIGFFSNPWVLAAWGVTVGLQVCAVYVPFLQGVLHTVPLGWQDWALMLAVAAPVFVVFEAYKIIRWRLASGQRPPESDGWSMSDV